MQSLSNARLRDDESSNQSRVDAVRSRLDRLRSQLMHKREATDRELADLESYVLLSIFPSFTSLSPFSPSSHDMTYTTRV